MLLTITIFRTEINRDIIIQAIFALLLSIKRIPIYIIPEKLHVSVCESVCESVSHISLCELFLQKVQLMILLTKSEFQTCRQETLH